MIQEVTGWDDVADRESLIVVYPDGMLYPLRWNANPNMNLESDDIESFRDLVAEISTLVSVDPKRVVVYVLEGMGHQWPGGDPFPPG